jgi:hypothetical protein
MTSHPHYVLATEIYHRMVHDAHHPSFYESVKTQRSVAEIVIVLLHYLDLHTSLQRQLSYDNIYRVFLHVIRQCRPDLSDIESSLFHITYFIKQDFLRDNLRKKRG